MPGPGTCGGMFTANTMAVFIEAIGMSLPGTAAHTAMDPKTGTLNAQKVKASTRVLGSIAQACWVSAPRMYHACWVSAPCLYH